MDNGSEEETPVLGPTWALTEFFQDLFGTLDWGDADPPVAYSSGPVRGNEGLGARRMADPEARFWYSAMMAEIMVLPLCVAHTVAEKASLNREIAQIVGLDIAVERGWIEGYTICWSTHRLPTTATKIRVRPAPGRRTHEQALGDFEPHIRRMIIALSPKRYD